MGTKQTSQENSVRIGDLTMGHIMRSPRAFPYTIAALSLAASISYFITGDWRRGLYWMFACGITVMVTL